MHVSELFHCCWWVHWAGAAKWAKKKLFSKKCVVNNFNNIHLKALLKCILVQLFFAVVFFICKLYKKTFFSAIFLLNCAQRESNNSAWILFERIHIHIQTLTHSHSHIVHSKKLLKTITTNVNVSKVIIAKYETISSIKPYYLQQTEKCKPRIMETVKNFYFFR